MDKIFFREPSHLGVQNPRPGSVLFQNGKHCRAAQPHDFAERVGQPAFFGDHCYATGFRRKLPLQRVTDWNTQGAADFTLGEIVGGRGDGGIPDRRQRYEYAGRFRQAYVDDFGARTKNAEVAPRIRHSRGCAISLKRSNRLIYRETFGNSPEVDEERSPETNSISRQENNVGRRASMAGHFPPMRQPASADQRGRDGDVEQTSGEGVQFHRAPNNTKSPGVYVNYSLRSALIEPSDITGRLIKAHEAVHPLDCVERRSDGFSGDDRVDGARADFDHGPEQWTGSAYFNWVF